MPELNNTESTPLTGSCLCGGVSYEIEGQVRDVINCFCSQCRKTSGHYVAATRVNKDSLTMTNDKTLQWYQCLPGVYRGFCNRCGGNVLWDNGNDNEVSVFAGTLDAPTHLKTIANIHIEDASDYHTIPEVDTS